jgi:hypothetical protein
MSIEATFLVGSATAMGIVLAVIWYLRKPMQAILSELCGKPERAQFWSAFSHVTLFLIPLIAVLSRGPELPFRQSGVFAICEEIKAGLTGLVGSVVTLGVVLSVYIARYIVSPAGGIPAEAGRHS